MIDYRYAVTFIQLYYYVEIEANLYNNLPPTISPRFTKLIFAEAMYRRDVQIIVD